jgi:uncharacterized protein (DUF1778 family)
VATKQLSGGARLLAAGKKPVCLGLTEDQHDLLRLAAQAEGRPITQFVTFHALQAAKKIFLKN